MENKKITDDDGLLVTIDKFYSVDKSERYLSCNVSFVTADGRNSNSEGLVELSGNGIQDPMDLINLALKHRTDFVKENWTSISVSTPMTNEYGSVRGGHLRLSATRELSRPELKNPLSRRFRP